MSARSGRAAMEWDLPASAVEPGDVDERLRAGVGRTGAMQVPIDHDAPGAIRCPTCGWASTSSRRDCPSRVIAKALLERKPLPVWLAHLAPTVPGTRARGDARSVEQRQAAEDSVPGLFDPPARMQADRAGEGR